MNKRGLHVEFGQIRDERRILPAPPADPQLIRCNSRETPLQALLHAPTLAIGSHLLQPETWVSG